MPTTTKRRDDHEPAVSDYDTTQRRVRAQRLFAPVVAVVGVVGALLATSSGGQAERLQQHRPQSVWTEPETVADESHRLGEMKLAAGPGRYAVVIWREPPRPILPDTDGGRTDDVARLMVSVREPDAAQFGSPRVLGRLATASGYGQVGISADGQTVLVWTSPAGRVLTRFRTPTSGWTAPQVVVDRNVGPVSMSVAHDGTTAVHWQEGRNDRIAMVAVRQPSGEFGKPKRIVRGVAPWNWGTVAAGSGGRAAAVWSGDCPLEGPPPDARGRVLEPSPGEDTPVWQPPEVLPNASCPDAGMRAAMDDNGNVTTVVNGSRHWWGGIRASWRPAGGPFPRAELISRKERVADFAQVATSGPGRSVIAWDTFEPRTVQASVRPAGTNTFPALLEIHRLAALSGVAVNQHGHTALLTQGLGGQRRLHAILQCPGRPFGRPELASPPQPPRGYTPAEIALNPDGVPLVAWTGYDPTTGSGVGVYVSERPAGPGCPPPGQPELLEDTTHQSVSVLKGGRPRPLVPNTNITLTFESRPTGDVIRWYAGCNTYGALVDATPRRLHLGEISGTDVGCPEPRHDQDDWLNRFFANNPYWELDGQHLTLAVRDTIITFRPTNQEHDVAQPATVRPDPDAANPRTLTVQTARRRTGCRY